MACYSLFLVLFLKVLPYTIDSCTYTLKLVEVITSIGCVKCIIEKAYSPYYNTLILFEQKDNMARGISTVQLATLVLHYLSHKTTFAYNY